MDRSPKAICKSKGTTRSEHYLARICEKAFLGLWSYPNVYRDQGRGGDSGDGKELCDLLVLFGRDVLIFSDKFCGFKRTGNLGVDWPRWYKRAVKKSADQLYGAERWIRENPDRVYLDRSCTTRLPIPVGCPAEFRVHRIVVAAGAKDACCEELGGSGSLVLDPTLIADDHFNRERASLRPFHVGQVCPEKGFVHVLDEVTLDIILRELDTVQDFVSYLAKKERWVLEGRLRLALGEENLLAVYLKGMNAQGEHDIKIPSGTQLVVEDGIWRNLQEDRAYRAKRDLDRASYLWDETIAHFVTHALGRSLREGPGVSLTQTEIVLRHMAKERRFDRRCLAQLMADIHAQAPDDRIAVRSVFSADKDTAYVFVFAPQCDFSDEEYRRQREHYLSNYCFVFAWKNQNYKRVIGIATESGRDVGSSHDLVLWEVKDWTPDLIKAARSTRERMGILLDRNVRIAYTEANEFPNVSAPALRLSRRPFPKSPEKVTTTTGRRLGRNERCPCGSGRKYKRCCGRQRSEVSSA